MSAQSLEDSKRQHPSKPQSIRPAAIWQKVQEYRFHTKEQLLSSGCDTPERILPVL